MTQYKSTCPACGGVGKKKNDSGKGYTDEDCPKCEGMGEIVTEETSPEDDPFRKAHSSVVS